MVSLEPKVDTVLRSLIMKKTFKLIGLVAMLAAIAFSMAACGDDLGSGPGGSGGGGQNPGGSGGSGGSGGGTVGNTGTLTITGFSSKFEGKYAAFTGSALAEDGSGTKNYCVRSSIKNTMYDDGYLISNGKVTMPVYKIDISNNAEPYFGNDKCQIDILTRTVSTGLGFVDDYTFADAYSKTFQFTNGSLTLAWSDDLISFKGKAW
jgi:hypothetical protein